MSPEQARGRTVDKRADIWAFGCVLYEMLTGTSAFGGEGVTDVLAKVINGEPIGQRCPAHVPSRCACVSSAACRKINDSVFHDVAGCAPRVGRRVRSLAVDHGRHRSSPDDRNFRLRRDGRSAALVAIAAGIGMWRSSDRTAADLPETRLKSSREQHLTPDHWPSHPMAAVSCSPAGVGEPLLPSTPRVAGRPPRCRGTDNGSMPFWSPDGQSIGFFAQGVLKRIDLPRGFVRTLAKAPQPRRGSWNRDGTIIFGAGSVGPLYRVPADGGAVEQATDLLPGQTNHRWPHFLPDGRRFLLSSLGTTDVRGVYRGSLGERRVQRVSDRESRVRVHGAQSSALSRDRARCGPGSSIPITPRPRAISCPLRRKYSSRLLPTGSAPFSASIDGVDRVPIFGRNPAAGVARIATDEPSPLWDARTTADMFIWDLSSDGRTAAISRVVDGNPDVWLVDTDRGVTRRLTTEAGDDGGPLLSPDGSRVLYVADGQDDVYQMRERRSDGTGGVTRVFESDENKNPGDWSPDGRYVLYTSQSPRTNFDLMALPLFGDRRPIEVARTSFLEAAGRFSPNGRWVAYFSDESVSRQGTSQPFPARGAKGTGFNGGGVFPRWRRDGRESSTSTPDSG
jgi:Tol biopolymer transport system component